MSSEGKPSIKKYLQSRDGGNMLTFLPEDNKFVMAGKNAISGSEQRIVGSCTPSGDSSQYHLSVFEKDIRLDFDPNSDEQVLCPSEPSTGQSQVWSLVDVKNKPNVCLIKSSNGGYLKNNGDTLFESLYAFIHVDIMSADGGEPSHMEPLHQCSLKTKYPMEMLSERGTRKSITIYQLKRERDLGDKSLQWLLRPAR